MKIILSAYTGLGNFILKTPLIKSLKEIHPNCQIHILLGNSWGVENVLKKSNFINEEKWLSREAGIFQKFKFFSKLKKEKYDLILLPFDSTPFFILLLSQLYLGKGKVVGHINVINPRINNKVKLILYSLFFYNIEWVPVLKGRHEIDLNLDLLQAVIKNNVRRDYQTIVTWKNEDMAHFNLPELFLVIQPLAANGAPTPKVWSPENFNKLIAEFLLKFSEMKVILVGDAGDVSRLKGLHILSNSNVINLLGKTTFNQLCNVLNSAQAVIAHDSGIMHVSNALQVPLIALYGPTDYTRTAPLASTTHVLHSRNDCWRKMYGFQGSEKKINKQYPNYYCMSGITVNQVMHSLRSILQNKP